MQKFKYILHLSSDLCCSLFCISHGSSFSSRLDWVGSGTAAAAPKTLLRKEIKLNTNSNYSSCNHTALQFILATY